MILSVNRRPAVYKYNIVLFDVIVRQWLKVRTLETERQNRSCTLWRKYVKTENDFPARVVH